MPGKYYRPDIDGLRAVAVALVVAYHAFPSLVPGGFVGVDAFFTISGFLITGIITRAIHKGEFSFADFYVRRARRILPALWLVVTLSLVAGWFLLYRKEYLSLAESAVAGLLFCVNFLLTANAGYFDTDSKLQPLLHLWSLAVEEQFYIFWPIVLILARRAERRIFLIIGLLFLGSFGLNVAFVRSHPAGTYYMLPTRFWELMLGGAIAMWQRGARSEGSRAEIRHPSFSNLASVTGAALIVLSAFLLDEKSPFPGYGALAPSFGTALVIVAGESALNRVVLASKALVYLGLISYPLYLWHWPLLSFDRILTGAEPSALSKTVLVMISVVLSALTYSFLEQPIQRAVSNRSIFRSRPVYAGALISSFLATLAAGGTIGLEHGVANRHVGASAIRVDDGWAVNIAPECEQFVQLDQAMFCKMSTPQKDVSVALLGDSHADHVYPGVAAAYGEVGRGVVVIGKSSCPPFSDPHYVNAFAASPRVCDDFNRQVFQFVESHPQIRTVILGFYYQDVAGGWHFPPDELRDHSLEDLVLSRLGDTVRRYEGLGRDVIVVEDVPRFGEDPHHGARTGSPTLLAKESDVARSAFFDRVARIACLFHTSPVFSDGASYTSVKDGVLLYRDKHHLSVSGSLLLVDTFRRSPCFNSPR